MATFTVNTSQDVVNANDGVLSLREAITAAASLPGRDMIQIATDLTFSGAPLPTLTRGNDIDFIGTTDATGGDTRRTLTRQNTSRLFTIDGAIVSFTNLTLQGGRAVGLGGIGGGGGGAGLGGAITILLGNLFVNDVIFANNQAIGGSSTGTAGN